MKSGGSGAIDEARGRAILKARFEGAGLAIVSDHPMTLAGRTVHLDGFDPLRRIGFEYITTEAGDRDEITPEVLDDLEARAARGELFVLLVDERQAVADAVLERAADRFLAMALPRLGPPGGAAGR